MGDSTFADVAARSEETSSSVAGASGPLSWSPWIPLQDSHRAQAGLTRDPGLYRVRCAGDEGLLYIGQTGSLRSRLSHLRGVFGSTIPWNDPHTAGPALWAHRRTDDRTLEVSVARVAGPKPVRMAWECVAIYEHRRESGASPAYNFGRMPAGYRTSGPRKSGRAGGLVDEELDCHCPSLAPAGAGGDSAPSAADWLGIDWVDIGVLGGVVAPSGPGLYLLWSQVAAELLYVGEASNLGARLRTHASGLATQFEGPVKASVHRAPGLFRPQRLELENDAIAAAFLHTGRPPLAQFGGLTGRPL